MAVATPRLRILSVGGNAVSAFLSWRLQATNACDVTLVWKQDHEYVSQYGINWTSNNGKEKHRFKPHATIRTPEEAGNNLKQPFDYVLLCIKALPDVYDLASVIESVVAPQHTCILLNTTSSLGVETYLEERFPSNVLLSLVCGADLVQTGATEFEHRGDPSDISVGWANKNPLIPSSIQKDMAEALAMTLTTGGVQCSVSENIRQQQFEKMIGPIAFYPASVVFDCPNHAELLEKVGVRTLIVGVIDELLQLAKALGCNFPADFASKTIEQMIKPADKKSFMWSDYVAKRPMEVETYLGSPIRLSKDVNLSVPRIESLYAMFHYKNFVNLQTPTPAPTEPLAVPGPSSPTLPNQAPPRSSSVAAAGPRPVYNGAGPNGAARRGPPPPGMMRRGPPPPNGFPRPMPNGPSHSYPGGPQYGHRRPSMDGEDLHEFSHLMLYDQNDGSFHEESNGIYANSAIGGSTTDFAFRERELALRARELELREKQLHMRQRRPPMPTPSHAGFDDDEDDDFFDPMEGGPNQPVVDENFDMLSVTSKRNRKMPPSGPNRLPGMNGGPPHAGGRNMFSRNKSRTSGRIMHDVPGLQDSLMNNSLMGYSSNRYGSVDRQAMGQESRQNSLTQARLDELQRGGGNNGLGALGPYGGGGGGPYPGMQRRASHSPGNPLNPVVKRPSPPNGFGPPPHGVQGGPPRPGNGRPSPPNGMMRQPVPRHPPGHGNAVAASQVEQYAGVSNIKPPIQVQVRSLTGSASASAGSGESALLDSDPSANSSQSSFQAGMRPRMGIMS